MRLVLEYPPSANEYWKPAVRRGLVPSHKALKYRERVRWAARKQLGLRVKPLEGPVVLSLTVYRPRRAGDLSNRIKVLEDALQGIAYEDDDQVAEIHALRLEDKANPRVELVIEAQGGSATKPHG